MNHHRTAALAGLAVALGSAPAHGQAVGPDMISSSHVDIARNGTNAAGTIVGYSIGSVTCNRGDLPANTAPDSSTRPLMAQGLFRLKTFTSASVPATYQRFEQIGQGWVKWVGVPVNGNSPTCGTCQGGAGSGQMGVNCADTYGSGFNGPAGMGRRTQINAATGVLTGTRGGGTDEASINTRVQVALADLAAQPAGTRFFAETVHLLPHDAQYLRPNQSVAINAMNNAASQEININAGTGPVTLIGGAANRQINVIERWREIDPGVTIVFADHDDTPNPSAVGKTIKCRYVIGAKVTDLSGTGAGPWRYEYAVYNLNSDRAARAISIPFPDAAQFSEFSFRHPRYHSGEAVSNAPWTAQKTANELTFATETFATSASANAIRWATLYNFGFTAPVPPATGTATITLFKPASSTAGTVTAITTPPLPVPSLPPPCRADFNHDGTLNPDDLAEFVNCYFAEPACAGADFDADGTSNADDLADYINVFFAGC